MLSMVGALVALALFADAARPEPLGPTFDGVATARRLLLGEGVSECSSCHADVAAQWDASAHHFSSFNNPYYRVSVERFRRDRGKPASQFCAGCHEPALAATLAMNGDVRPGTPAAQSGIVCLACHSIDAADRRGNGRYHAMLMPFDGKSFAFDPEQHRARLRPPLLSEPRFCATCHKVGLSETITRAGWLRGQDDFHAFDDSAVSGHGAASVFRPPANEAPKRCQDCHMPLEPAPLGDRAAKNGMIRSHRFIAANTALPNLRGDAGTLARVAAFLRGTVSLDLVHDGHERVDAVLRARGVGHRFPGGTMDSNEVWIEMTAFDGAGQWIASSGHLNDRGDLDPGAHLVRTQPVDERARPLLHRDPQNMRGVVFDASLSPSDPQVVCFRVPAAAARIVGRVLYRKFTAAYARDACKVIAAGPARRRCEAIPVVEIASAEVRPGATSFPAEEGSKWAEYGIALADAPADRADAARGALDRARALLPAQVTPLLGLARLSLRLGQTDAVLSLTDRARALAPGFPAIDWLRAQAALRAFRAPEALASARALVARLPEDRNALVLLAEAAGLAGRTDESLAAADQALRVDPELAAAHYLRSLALEKLGRTDEAARSEAAYLRHRPPVETNLALRRTWLAARRGLPDEGEPVHLHDLTVNRPATDRPGCSPSRGRGRRCGREPR